MDYLSENKEKNAGTVEEPKPKTTEPMPLDIPKKALALAQSVGIDLKPIVNWAVSVEQRLNVMAEEMPQKTAEALMKMAEEQRQKQLAQMQTAGQGSAQPMQGMSSLMNLLPALLGSGGGNPMMEQMMERMMQKSIMGMDLSNALTKAMIIRLAPSLAEELTKTMVPTTEG